MGLKKEKAYFIAENALEVGTFVGYGERKFPPYR